MAITRMTMDQLKATPSKMNRAKVATTTEADIRRHMIEDGEDPAQSCACGKSSPRQIFAAGWACRSRSLRILWVSRSRPCETGSRTASSWTRQQSR